jgi:uncharacterized protein (TIGR03435 family)
MIAYAFTLSFSDTFMSPRAGRDGAGCRPAGGDRPDGLALFEAVKKEWRLKIEKRNIPSSVVVLDHIGRQSGWPTELKKGKQAVWISRGGRRQS